MMDEIDKRIINRLQKGFPVSSYPFQDMATELDIESSLLLDRLQRYMDEQLLTRFGPLFHAEQMGGKLTLAAMKVPETEFDRVAAIVNDFPEVAHNYERNHRFNMWFVLATEHPDRVAAVIGEIESSTGLKVYNMPKISEYFVGLELEV